MEKKNKDILKKGLMETNMDFTSNLMDKINAEEKAMSKVLSKNGAMETSSDFTLDLMSKLEGKVPAKPYTPIISRRVWVGIAAVFSGIIVLALLTAGQDSNSIKYDLRVDQITDGFASFFKDSPIIVYACLGSLLLTLGLLFEQKSRRNV